MRRALAGICLVSLLAVGCGGGDETSLEAYVESVNAMVNQTVERYQAIVTSPSGRILLAERSELSDYTPQDLQVALDRTTEMQLEVKKAGDAIEPPDQVADLHGLMFRFDFISIDQALAARAATATDWEELSGTPEMAAYRAQVAQDKQACRDLQAELNATAEGEGFAIDAWLSAELREIVDAGFGCESFPENPEDLFRPLATPGP